VPGNPAATIRKMETVRRAALAPSQPSAKDRQVAAEAQRKAQEARRELREDETATAGTRPDQRRRPQVTSAIGNRRRRRTAIPAQSSIWWCSSGANAPIHAQ